MNDCTICANAIWCPTWAEWKCVVQKKRHVAAVTNCDDFKPKAKSFKEPECQCEDCLANAEE